MRLARNKDGVTVDSTTIADEDGETVVSDVYKIKMLLFRITNCRTFVNSKLKITLNTCLVKYAATFF